MSLIVSNRATDKQLEVLKGLGYIGENPKTVTDAQQLIDELFEEIRLDRARERWSIEFEGQSIEIF